MKAADQTRITLKNVHYAAFNSEETNCFSATLYFDGKPVCTVGNDGHGGYDYQHPLKGETYRDMEAKLAPVTDFVRTLDPLESGIEGAGPLAMDLDLAVGEVFERWLVESQMNKLLKSRVLYTRSDKPGVYETKKGTAHHAPALKAAVEAKNPGVTVTVLNLLPQPEALRIFMEGAR